METLLTWKLVPLSPRLSDFAVPIGQLGSLFSGIRVLRFELPDDFSVPLSDCPVAAQCHEH